MSLKKLSYLSRSQIQVMHDLKSTRTANHILKEMEPYLSHFRDGENIYYLNKEGRERVNAKKVLKKTVQARHYIMRNSIYIAFGCPSTWKNEMKLEVPNKVKVISDALFMKNKVRHIVEVDHTQKMSKNRDKVERYRKLIELGVFDKQPKVIWITTTELRRKQLTDLCQGLDVQIFTVNDFH
ncbi:replication-relaxation family protein [Sutcliffiella horikoshii]|uniref:replication-relaxation family protein n=1 Tax=Sutcliffiella horikoshii TaxID=79883 RepID=UPI003CF28B27